MLCVLRAVWLSLPGAVIHGAASRSACIHWQLTTDSFAVEPSVPSLAVVVGADGRPVHRPRGRRPHGAGNPRGLNVVHLQHVVMPSLR